MSILYHIPVPIEKRLECQADISLHRKNDDSKKELINAQLANIVICQYHFETDSKTEKIINLTLLIKSNDWMKLKKCYIFKFHYIKRTL